MNTLTELRVTLEVKREAEAALDLLHKPGTSGFDEVSWKRAYYRLKHLEDDLHALITDDTIRALLDVVADYEWLATVRDEFMLSQEKEARKLHALLAEHEAVGEGYGDETDDADCDCLSCRIIRAHDNAERVIRAANS